MNPVDALREIGFLLERSRSETHRVRAYRNAADTVAAMPEAERQERQREQSWAKVPGIGPKTATVIREAMAGGVPEYLDRLRAEKEPLTAGGLTLRARIRGDLHTHSTWSDGGSPVEEMMATARRLGHEYCAVTDHSPRLTVARGLTSARLRDQIAMVDDLNSCLAPFRALRGIEVDILEDGGLDQEDALLGELDVVVASVHSKLRSDSETMTHRMVRAIANPRVNVLGHCTGRLIQGERGLRPESVSTPRWCSRPAVPSMWRSKSIRGPNVVTPRPDCSRWPWRWAACSPSTPMPTRLASSSSSRMAASGPRHWASRRTGSSPPGRSSGCCSGAARLDRSRGRYPAGRE